MFEPKRVTVAELYHKPACHYLIPRYQREYSWEEDQLDDFWKLLESDEPTFLGTVIFFVDDDDSSIKEIIDGQQRHITTSIFGAALRDYFIEQAKANQESREIYLRKANGFQTYYIGSSDALSDEDDFTFYLTPGVSTRPVFSESIQKFRRDLLDIPDDEITIPKGRTKEEKRIYKAYSFFKERIAQYASGNPLKAQTLHDNFSKHQLLQVEIKDISRANEIFESVNEKGLSLNASDLIKNQILRHFDAGSKNEEEALNQWLEMSERLDSANFQPKMFLRYFWASKYEYVSDKRLYKAIKQSFNTDSNSWKKLIIELVDESKNVANIFNWSLEECRELTGHHSSGRKLYQTLRVLRASSSATGTVLLMSVLRNIERMKAVKFDFTKHLTKFHQFLFLYFDVMGYPGNWFFTQMCDTATGIQSAKTSEEFASVFKSLFVKFKGRLSNISEEEFIERFCSISYSDTDKGRRQLRYILSEYETSLRGNDTEGWDDTLISLEHFLPQDPKNWGFKKSEVKHHVHRIGNIVKIPHTLNGKLGNKNYSEKVELIKESNHNLSQLRELIDNAEKGIWDFRNLKPTNFDAIQKRGEKLGKAAYKMWVTDLKGRLL
jgi:uncharacterized protein with ParB-like and HNH nuclease domain